MAWTQERNGRFRGLYRDSSGAVKSAGTFSLESAALSAAEECEGAGLGVMPTWRKWEPEWWKRRDVAPSTERADRGRIEKYVMPRWGDVPLDEIRPDDVQVWLGELSAVPLGASTVRSIKNLLSSSLKAAIGARVLNTGNPCSGLNLPKLPPSIERFLTDAEADALMDAFDGIDLLAAHIALGAGLRWGEVAGLHWDQINFDDQTIEITHAYDRHGKAIRPPKSHQKRFVPIGATLTKVLREELQRSGYGKPPSLPYENVSKARHGLVVTLTGGPYSESTFANRVIGAGNAAKVKGPGGMTYRVGHVRPHDLRHTFGFRLARAGIPPTAIKEIMGHSSLTVTERYTRTGNASWSDVRKTLG